MNARRLLLVLALPLAVACSSAAPASPKTAAPPTAASQATSAPAQPVAAPTSAPASKPAEPATPKPAPGAAAKPASAAPAGNPLDLVMKSYQEMAKLKSYRADMTTTGLPTGTGTGSSSGTSKMKMEVVLPDRIHAVGDSMEMLMAGGSVWMKDPDGSWQKFAMGLDFDAANPKQLEEQLSASTDHRLIGPELLDGTPTMVYEYKTTFKNAADPAARPPGAPTNQVYTAKVWIGVADNLPRKVESADPNSPARTTILYYDYNAPITIDLPA